MRKPTRTAFEILLLPALLLLTIEYEWIFRSSDGSWVLILLTLLGNLGLAVGIFWLLGREGLRAIEKLADWKWALDLVRMATMVLALNFCFRSLLPSDLISLATPLSFGLSGFFWSTRHPIAWVFWCGILFLAFLGTGWLGAYEAHYGVLGKDDYDSVFQTDFREAYLFASSNLREETLRICLIMTGIFLAYGVSLTRTKAGTHGPRRVAVIVIVFSLSVITGAFASPVLTKRIQTFQRSAQEFERELQLLKKTAVTSDEEVDRELSVLPALVPKGNMIVIVGESTQRGHMGIYGYHRDTTPRLQSRRDQILLHQDTVSPFAHTVHVLREMLSTARQNDPRSPALPTRFLLPLMKKLGIQTYWFSNQNQFGTWDNPVTLMAQEASVSKFFRKSFGKDTLGGYFDHLMLPSLAETLRDGRPGKLIFLHLFATHIPYCKVIPDSFNYLKEEDGLGKKYFGSATDHSKNVNCYDNSVRYVDSLITDVLEIADSSAVPTAVVFASDHGENPDEKSGRANSVEAMSRSARLIEVPHLWYFNASGRSAFKNLIETLKTNLQRPFLNSWLFESILDFWGVNQSLFEKKLSLFSNQFAPYPRLLSPVRQGSRNEPQYVNYDLPGERADYLERARFQSAQMRKKSERDWQQKFAANVNSLAMLLEAKQYFAGVNIPIQFFAQSSRFKVVSPNCEDVDLSLDEMFSGTGDRPELRFWLEWDVKNPKDLQLGAVELSRLEQRFSLRGRLVIDVQLPGDPAAGDVISGREWTLAYRPDPGLLRACAWVPATGNCVALAKRVAQNAKRIGASHISFDPLSLPFIEAHSGLFESLGFLHRPNTFDGTADKNKNFVPKVRPEHVRVEFPSKFKLNCGP